MAAVQVPPPRLGPPRALALGDVAQVLDEVAGDRRAELLVWLAYGCGLRAAEIAALRIEDCHLGARPHLRVRGKGRKQRLVPLHPRVAAVLLAALAGRPSVGPVVESHRDQGRGLSAKTVSHLLGEALRTAGVAATGQQLRHTFATELLAAGEGTNIRAVSRLLGHSQLEVTERYVGAYDADAWAAVHLLPDPAGRRM